MSMKDLPALRVRSRGRARLVKWGATFHLKEMGTMNPQYNMRRLLAGVVAGGLLLISPATAQEARQNLRAATAELAKSAKAVVEKEDQQAVRIGRFVPTGLDDSNAGDGIGAAGRGPGEVR